MSASVKIDWNAEEGHWRVLVNGEDMSYQILAKGFEVKNFDSEFGIAEVCLRLASDDLTIDMPEAEVEIS